MGFFSSTTTLVVLAAASVVSALNPADYANSAELDPSYTLYWTTNNVTGTLRLGISAKTAGWVGFGLSPDGGMVNADIMIATVGTDNKLTVSDRRAVSKVEPKLDTKVESDWVAVGGAQVNGVTSIEVTRKVDTGDIEDDVVISLITANRVIWAFGTDSTVGYHTSNRGSASIDFGNSVPAPPVGAQSVDLRFPEHTLPSTPTNYLCYPFKLPSSSVELHALRFDPLIGSKKHTHHMILFTCTGKEEFLAKGPLPQACGGMKATCTSILYGWAVGGGPFILPEAAGMPFGIAESTYAMLEIHYDNPQGDKGVVDNSGVRIYYSETHRPNAMGVLKLGVPIPDISIPANTAKFALTNECVIPSSPATAGKSAVVAAFAMHMHEHGTSIWSAQYRDNQFVATLGRNLAWDFNIQEITTAEPGLTVMQGDVIQTTCLYNTVGKGAVKGGDASEDEMCINFLLYYPRIKTGSNPCIGKVTTSKPFEGNYPWEPGNGQKPTMSSDAAARFGATGAIAGAIVAAAAAAV